MKKLLNIAIIASVFLAIIIYGCAKEKETQGHQDEKFTISSSGANFEFSVEGLIKDFKPVNADVISINSSGVKTSMNVTGVPLSDLLIAKGINKSSYNSIRAVAGDGYSIEISEEILSKRNVILAYKINGDFLKEKNKPVRIIVPDERAMYWVGNVVKIELIKAKETVSTGKIIFLETAYKNLPQTKYMYQDSYDLVVPVKDLLSAYCPVCDSDLSFVCKDSLKKAETKENALISYLKITGKGKPLFLSPDLPGGMWVKNILFLKQNNVCFYSLESALETVPDRNKGIALTDILKNADMAESNNYLITALDSSQVTINKDRLNAGTVFLNDNACVLIFQDQAAGKPVNEILSIETAE